MDSFRVLPFVTNDFPGWHGSAATLPEGSVSELVLDLDRHVADVRADSRIIEAWRSAWTGGGSSAAVKTRR